MISTASRTWPGFELPGLSAFFLDEANAIDSHRFIDRLQHVVERQACDRHGSQRFHLDAGLAGDFDFSFDEDAGRDLSIAQSRPSLL